MFSITKTGLNEFIVPFYYSGSYLQNRLNFALLEGGTVMGFGWGLGR